MIRAVGYLLREALWTLVFRIAPPQRWEDDDPDSTAAQVAARTRWVQERRPDRG